MKGLTKKKQSGVLFFEAHQANYETLKKTIFYGTALHPAVSLAAAKSLALQKNKTKKNKNFCTGLQKKKNNKCKNHQDKATSIFVLVFVEKKRNEETKI